MKVIICGGRDFTDKALFERSLARFAETKGPITFVVHGDYRGADTLARKWASDNHVPQKPFPPDDNWPSAGPRRNQQMADFGADYCIAFPGGSGTNDMVTKALKADIPVWDVASDLTWT